MLIKYVEQTNKPVKVVGAMTVSVNTMSSQVKMEVRFFVKPGHALLGHFSIGKRAVTNNILKRIRSQSCSLFIKTVMYSFQHVLAHNIMSEASIFWLILIYKTCIK